MQINCKFKTHVLSGGALQGQRWWINTQGKHVLMEGFGRTKPEEVQGIFRPRVEFSWQDKPEITQCCHPHQAACHLPLLLLLPPPVFQKDKENGYLTLAHPTSSCILFYSMDIYPSNAGGGVMEELPQTCLDFMDGTDPLLDMYKEWDLWDSSSRMTAWQVKVWHGSWG